jgi:mono/diheme cytochrome c family protein
VSNQLSEKQLHYAEVKKMTIGGIMVIVMIILSIMVWWLIPVKDPYVKEVLSFQGSIERGHSIFLVNCASCHGINGNGNVGPSLLDISKHKSDGQIIHQVIQGKTPPMPKFQPLAEDMADLLSYLRQLS